MRRVADTVMTEALEQPTALALRQRLGDFYDLEFCRLSLMTLSAVEPLRVGREFRRSSDRYVAALFEACVQEIVEAEGLASAPDPAGFALFATGGNAREDPFDVDYDLFAVLSRPDPRKKRFFNRVLARLTRALLERGIMPQNRFGERVSAHLCTCGELAELLSAAPPDGFIEKTELLGARRVVGDPEVDQILNREVVEPFVFEDPSYPLDLLAELCSRRLAGAGDEMEIKETPGGLRDVAILLAILKARVRLRWPDGPALYARLRLELPELGAALDDVEKTATFLRRLRDVYRLTVVGEDHLASRYFGILALFMGYGHHPGGGAAELLADYRAALGRVRSRLRECLGALGLGTEGI
jgi:UTP:GlnB (protein PII) uridylyltransferase